jgi:ApaG protein
MDTSTSSGIRISSITALKDNLSQIDQNYFFYGYTIEIENYTKKRVKLISRHWDIFDSLNALRIVDGEGVIGEQPVLEPGECFSYSSSCDLHSELGFMQGYFTFVNLDSNETFKVEIPRFLLHFWGRMN